MLWTASLALLVAAAVSLSGVGLQLPQHERLSRLFRRPWPPRFWCFCCRSSAPSSSASNPLIKTSCCPNSFPTTLHVTFSNSGGCGDLDGKTFPLTFSATGTFYGEFSGSCTPTVAPIIVGVWLGSFSGSCNWQFQFACYSGGLAFSMLYSVSGPPTATFCGAFPTTHCSPLNCSYPLAQNLTGCCNFSSHSGTATVTL